MSTHPADRIAIQDVMARYAKHIDERELDLFRELFDPAVEVEGFSPEPLVGHDAWLAVVESTLAHFGPTQHMLGPVLAEIDGDSARARTDVRAIHVHVPPRTGLFRVFGTYHTGMVRRSEGWRIVRHALSIVHMDAS